jgi:hypothetical protein
MPRAFAGRKYRSHSCWIAASDNGALENFLVQRISLRAGGYSVERVRQMRLPGGKEMWILSGKAFPTQLTAVLRDGSAESKIL